MAKNEYLLNLFRSHLADLQDVCSGTSGVFVCPICLREFSEADVYNKNLSYGHVWPLDMRRKSDTAKNMAVLLCKDCNNKAGSRGDYQMQLYERIKSIPENGEKQGVWTVEIIDKPGEKPIRMRVEISKEDSSIEITGKLNQLNQWVGSSPDDQARFIELAKKSLETQQEFTVNVLTPNEYKPNLAGAGWITSAYLMAFYTLGYRYIFNSEFDFIREYVRSSFDSTQEEPPKELASENFHILVGDTLKYPDPKIRICMPVKNEGSVTLEVCFLRCEVTLPIFLEPNLFYGFKSYCSKQAPGQPFPPVGEGDFPCLYSNLYCTKTIEHTCIFDYLLGKPLPDAFPEEKKI